MTHYRRSLGGVSVTLAVSPDGNLGVPRLPNPESVLEHRPRITRALIRWGRRNARAYPWREQLPLWQALIAEVMLQRTRAEQVVPTFNEFRIDTRARPHSPAPATRSSPVCSNRSVSAGVLVYCTDSRREIARLHGSYRLTSRLSRRCQASARTRPAPRSPCTPTAEQCSSTRTSCEFSADWSEPRTMARLVGSDGSASWPRLLHRRVHIVLTTMPYSTWQRLCACLARQSATSAPFSIGVQRG